MCHHFYFVHLDILRCYVLNVCVVILKLSIINLDTMMMMHYQP